MKMRTLEKSVEFLRPLVLSNAWDYCVVWKLGGDPSRFIEWKGCCCSGGCSESHVAIKEEGSEGEYQFARDCRDTQLQHSVRTRACEALAVFPSTLPLYPGIHGEVAVSSQPRWLTQSISSDSNSSYEPGGTQVLIPVGGGLVELFSTKQIPKDQKIIDYVKAQFSGVEEQESKTIPKGLAFQPLAKPDVLSSAMLPTRSHLSFRSSRCSEHDLSFDSGSTDVSEHTSKFTVTRRLNRNGKLPHQYVGMVSGSGTHVIKGTSNANMKGIKKSKNLVSERKRRNRIKGAILTLRTLVPKISKMDIASTLGDASNYIMELQEEAKKLDAELQESVEEEYSGGAHEGSERLLATREIEASSSNNTDKEPMKAHVEVNQMGANHFLLKIYAEHERGGFARLMKAMDYLGLEVVDANVSTFTGIVFHIFKVEVKSKEMHPEELQESLIKLIDLTRLGYM